MIPSQRISHFDNNPSVSSTESKYSMLIVFYILMILNLGVGNITSGYLYLYTSTNYLVALASGIIIMIGFPFLIKSPIIVERNIFIMQFFYILSTLVTLLINERHIINYLSSLYLAIMPLVLCILAIEFALKNDGFRFIKKYIAVYAFWLSMQTLFTSINLYITQGYINKSLVKVSIGGSNYIAAHLIVCLVFLVLSGKRHIEKVYSYLLILIFLTIMFTISFGAGITLFFVLSLYLVFRGRFGCFRHRVFLIFFLIITIMLIFIIFKDWIFKSIDDTSILYIPISKFSKKVQYLLKGNYSSALAGRDRLYRLAIRSFYNKPIFGNGEYLYYMGKTVRTHNWILDSLVFRGALGTLFYIMLVIYVMYMISRLSYFNGNLVAIKYALFTGLVHGMIEPNFFTRTFDFLWWLLASIAIGEIIKTKRQLKTSTEFLKSVP